MMRGSTTDVGMDTSKSSIQVAMLLPESEKAVEWELVNEPRAVRRMAKRLKREAVGELRVCYEAGPCGYALQRQLRELGVNAIVVAPSLIPMKPGERVKTNRRDAVKLAVMLRAAALTEVHPPTLEEESVRDLCRCRDDIREDMMRARHRLMKMLLRRGVIYPSKGAWTEAHRRWLRSLAFEHEAARATFDDYVRAIEHLEERLATVESAIESTSQREPYREPVAWLRCFRGIDTVTALSVVAELHDFGRFQSARELMSYLGLVPSENSTGDRQRRGPITKTGNKHARRLLIEASWHYRHKPAVGRKLGQRREGQPGWVIALADRAQARLHRRYWRLVTHGKAHNKAVTAVARELSGFLWAALREHKVAKASEASVN